LSTEPVTLANKVADNASPSLLPGERTDTSGKPVRNHMLLSLPDAEYAALRPYLEHVDLPDHLILHQPEESIDAGYFLNSGLASLIVVTTDGRTVEVGITGREGFVGVALAADLRISPYRAVIQISGNGVRIKANAIENLLSNGAPTLRQMLHRYAQIQGLQVAQIAACNRLHEVEERLARWLLMTQDRVDSEWIEMTHDFLASMLGTGRPSVSLAAASLQRGGMIEYVRGAVRIVNRKSLEEASCECYRVIQNYNGGLGLK
jgi:CRP-like cAMP-binding protein